MKKLFIYSLFLFTVTIVTTSLVSADTIMRNSHKLDRCVKIINLDDFSETSLIAHIRGPMVEIGHETYQIKNEECLSKGYKFNSLNIYHDLVDPNNLLLENIETYGGHVKKRNPLIKEDIEYSLVMSPYGKLALYKFKKISTYNDGTPEKVQFFDNSVNLEEQISVAKPVKRSFWKNFTCSIKKIFGIFCNENVRI